MKIILAGYREWALKSFDQLALKYPNVNITVVENHRDLLKSRDSIILCAGWMPRPRWSCMF